MKVKSPHRLGTMRYRKLALALVVSLTISSAAIPSVAASTAPAFSSAPAAAASLSVFDTAFTAAAESKVAAGNMQVAGLIVRYRPGVAAIDLNGNATAAEVAGVKISESRHLGGDFYSLKFDEPLTHSRAVVAAARVRADSRVALVELDRILTTTASRNVSPRSAITAASPPTALKATDAWSATNPSAARVKLTWRKSTLTFGANIVGYRIEKSSNNGANWVTLLANTGSKKTTKYLSAGLVAGTKYSFRVRAITKRGSATKVGRPSISASAKLYSAPQPAVFQSTGTATNSVSPFWFTQTAAERGGYSQARVTYSAIARAEGFADVSSTSCSLEQCIFTDLIPNVSYQVEVTATNPRGSSVSRSPATASDEYFLPYQWYLWGNWGVNAPNAWAVTRGSEDIVVAVIDTGITEHPELAGRLVDGYDFISDPAVSGDGDGRDSDPTDPGDGDPAVADQTSSWHGTFVAGIIAASSDESGQGIAGLASQVKISPIRALGIAGGSEADLVAAINWASGLRVGEEPLNQNPAKVINMSLGTTEVATCGIASRSAILNAKNRGISVIAAAGNSNTDAANSYPGNCPGVITVGATNAIGWLAPYSNDGSKVNLSAPGGDVSSFSIESPGAQGFITSISNSGDYSAGTPGYALAEGTSFAAPLVSATAALMYSLRPNLKPDRLLSLLISSSKRFPPESTCATSNRCGAGLLDAGRAVSLTLVEP